MIEPIGVEPPPKPADDREAALKEASSVNDKLRAAVSGIVLSDEKTAELFEREPAIRLDKETGSIAWVAVNKEFKFSSVVWLLPQDLPAGDHLRSLKAALNAAAVAVPEALDWEVHAEFETPGEPRAAELKALTWQPYFTNVALGMAAKVEVLDRAGMRARISLPTLKEAIVVAEAWK